MAEPMRQTALHLDMIERPFYIRTIHTTLHSPRPLPAHVTCVRSDDSGLEIHAPPCAFIP